MQRKDLGELASLFFQVRQIVRSKLPGTPDPRGWVRKEALAYIARTKAPRGSDLAAYLRVKASSAASLIAHLERAGHIERRAEGGDKRAKRLCLTPRGRMELRSYIRRASVAVEATFASLEREEVERMVRVLRRVRDAAGEK